MNEKKSRIWALISILLAVAAVAAIVFVVCKKIAKKKKLKKGADSDFPEIDDEDSLSDVEELSEIDGGEEDE